MRASTLPGAPGGCRTRVSSLRRCWRIRPGRRRDRGHPAEHGEASPRWPACEVRPDDRRADRRRTSRWLARRSEPGAFV